ncbi:hypothetical protein B0A80_20145, partial [Flavobacterium tructae]|uniref:thioesterase domain-containing protein n=1 Tax=Flavobacterium tructae TaxID=1114873 RepID=UPI000B73DB49
GIHDNFFELGGHSLLVLKLTNIVNEKLGTDFSINSIFQYPTIFEFTGGIEFLDYSKYKLMIALQEKGNSQAIYLAPPASGTANCYIELVKSLGINQPVYAFQCKGLDGQCSVSSSIEEMASEFIIEMQTVDPYGPYRLGGFSFGARVVYEMAFQLEKMGFYVEELLIFDGMVLFEEKSTINQDRKFREFLMELTDTFGEDFNWPELIPEGKSKEEQIQLLGELLENSKYNISKEELKGRLEVDFANENYSYLPKNEIKLDTRIILFKAGNTLIKMDDKIIKYSDLHEVDYGWNQYTNKEVVVHTIPCTHTNILNKEHVEKISYYLK